ncbi:thermostable hemolysin [Telmatospirillum siberiense]|nr:thermostable hemolysin [Telmatospirillum siberiense]
MFEIIDPGHRMRPMVETCIRTAFLRDYDARLGPLPRCLVADTDGVRVTCAASVRFARDGFFSERYLDQPVEALIACHTGGSPDRRAIAEVGSLAANQPGKAESLIRDIGEFLRSRGIRWGFFTATARLRLFLGRAGISMTELAMADPARIEAAEMWGNYYRQFPKVMLVDDARLALAVSSAITFEKGRAVPTGWGSTKIANPDPRHLSPSGGGRRAAGINHAA